MSSPVVQQRESHQRKSKTNHQFLKKRYAEPNPEGIEEEEGEEEVDPIMSMIPHQTPIAKVINKEFEEPNIKRSNSEDLEGLSHFFPDLPTATNSIQVLGETKFRHELLIFDEESVH